MCLHKGTEYHQLTDYVTKPMTYCHHFGQEFIDEQSDRKTHNTKYKIITTPLNR